MAKKTTTVAPGQPTQISLLVEAMQCHDENAARLLVHKAMNAIFEKPSYFSQNARWTDADYDAVVSLIRGIRPKDTVESILAAQVIVLNIQGLDIIQSSNMNTKGQGLMMIRLSHQALETLQKYRHQSPHGNTSVNIVNQGDAVLNAVIKTIDEEKMENSPWRS